jgi:hypothetical protein
MTPYYIESFTWDGQDLIVTVKDMNNENEKWTKKITPYDVLQLCGIGSKDSK